MEIDTHILSLTMEFERQNIIITEWETERAKNARDKKWKKKNSRRKAPPASKNKKPATEQEQRNNEDIKTASSENNQDIPGLPPSSDAAGSRNVPTIVIDSEVIR